MQEINLEDEIRSSFLLSVENVVPDEFIVSNPELLWLEKKIDYMIYVPSHVLWCLKKPGQRWQSGL